MVDHSNLDAALEAPGQAWLAKALTEVDEKRLPELFPQLPRRLGRQLLATGQRACDAAACLLLQQAQASGDQVLDLYQHGDMEEKTMLMASLRDLPLQPATAELFRQALRSNILTHFEAAVCDSDLLQRAFQVKCIQQDDLNRLLLKLAFVNLPLARVQGAESLANPELSRMLQDLATEREAAGRHVWSDTNYLIALAPTQGTRARLAGGLEHGEDATRLATARGLQHLQDPYLQKLGMERREREPVAEIRQALQ